MTESFSASCRRVLENGPASPDDHEAACYLIAQGLADGRCGPPSKGRENYGKITQVVWFGITPAGRLWLERLSAGAEFDEAGKLKDVEANHDAERLKQETRDPVVEAIARLPNPIRLILTAGQVADITQGAALVEAIPTEAVIADKGYDSDVLVQIIEATGAQAIIPPRSNRNSPRKIDWHRYKARNLVERFFNRLKQFRRLATRYDKLANRFNAFLHLACAYIWLL